VLEHVRVSPQSGEAVLVENANVRIAAGAQYRAHFASFGSKLSRMEVEIALEGATAPRRTCRASRCWTASVTAT
jgi:Fe-S cluster assembly protein SufD